MRIVGGAFKGRKLIAPDGRGTRPTSDRVRESVFNILTHANFAPDLNGASVVDIFAGTGAMGLEALSRGAATLTFVENDDYARGTILKNAGVLGKARAVTVLKLDATQLPPPPRIAKCPVAIAFLDAPYDSDATGPALQSMTDRGWITSGSLCVVETAAKQPFEPPRGFTLEDHRTYGAAMISFLTRQ